jgi:hypothetical protein
MGKYPDGSMMSVFERLDFVNEFEAKRFRLSSKTTPLRSAAKVSKSPSKFFKYQRAISLGN